METNGSLDFEKHKELLDYCDGVMLDIKAADPAKHEELTGRGNEQVFKNAEFLAKENKLVEVRTLITGTDYGEEETIIKTASLLRPFIKKNAIALKLIPFRVFGVRREFRSLGIPTQKKMDNLRVLAKSCGFKQVIIS